MLTKVKTVLFLIGLLLKIWLCSILNEPLIPAMDISSTLLGLGYKSSQPTLSFLSQILQNLYCLRSFEWGELEYETF